jgi:hypothetical protein
MPITTQEARCIDLACRHLAAVFSGSWQPIDGPSLDDLHPSEPTPEVIVTNDHSTAAIEVKRLTGDSVFQAYLESILSLRKSLVPSCGGFYWLSPPPDFRLPVELPLRRQVKKEIERLAPTLAEGQSGPIRILREANVALVSKSGPSHIHCLHQSPDLLRPLLNRIQGQFFLMDEGLEHSFITDEGREAFYEAVARACRMRLEGNFAPVKWWEEWELTRGHNDDEDDEVAIIAVTEARDMNSSVREAVYAMIEKGRSKFIGRRWADRHVLVLETSILAPARLVTSAVGALEPEELEDIDLLLLVEHDELLQCYP